MTSDVLESGRDAFKGFLSALTAITESDWRHCADLLIPERFAPGCVIQRTGAVCDRVRFLVSGLARSYLLDEKGRDFTWSLHFAESGATLKNRFVIDYASFTQGEPSHLCIEALTEVEVISIKKPDAERLFAESLFWANVGRMISDLAYQHTHHRVLSLLTLPARERYEQLLKESPILLRVAPQHFVASYLGITPQSLSRLRRDLALPNANDARVDHK
jgi:CRP-like cAMP-binding protein